MKAKGMADLLTAKAEIGDFEGSDVLRIFPTSKGKELIIRMNELAEPIRDYITELKAWEAVTNLVDEHIIDKRFVSNSLYISPVTFEMHYLFSEKHHLCPNDTLRFLPVMFKESIVQLKLINVHIDRSAFDGFESVLIKCIYLRYVELDNNEMEESVCERITRYISEWAIDKIKVLKIKNNKLNYNSCRSLSYSLNIRIGKTQSLSEEVDRKQHKNYGSFNSLTLSNCGLEDWFISEFCEILYKYNQPTLMRCDFSDNFISDRSIQQMAEAIRSHRVISHLNIAGSRLVTASGLETFLSLSLTNDSLVELDYRKNPIRRRVYEKIFRFLKDNRVIQKIYVDLDEEGFYISKSERYRKYLSSYRLDLI